ncbi:MAG: 2,3,4,5-tetrahydropyridine-2,6-dicarboxylate N-succinyltransferase, partial [Pseudomonadota bacterium]|nr:2,3,4,5-tetrahydropyridine-2,6-dicarboxylate N-succinyltransferase [Pseudomonadota bacterium]
MKLKDLENTIDAAFEDAGALTPDTQGDIRAAVEAALDLLDAGTARVAERIGDDWHVNQWLKKAVLLSFRLNAMTTISGGPGDASWWDKVPSKFDGW